MSEIVNLSRRRALKGTLAGGMVLGLHVGGARMAFAASPLASALLLARFVFGELRHDFCLP